MQRHDNMLYRIKERLYKATGKEVCALLILSPLDENITIDTYKALDTLKHLFRKNDIVDYIGDNHFGVFFEGEINSRSLREKIYLVSEGLWLANKKTKIKAIPCFVGAYLFRNNIEDIDNIFDRAYEAFKKAQDDERHYHIIQDEYLDSEVNNGDEILSKNAYQQYSEKRDWLEFLSAKTNMELWEVDLNTRTLYMVFTSNRERIDNSVYRTVYDSFPESLIESGLIHRDSANAFREFAKEMLEGKEFGSANFMVQYKQSGIFGWATLTYETLHDENGRPTKIIGIKEDITYKQSKIKGAILRPMPEALYPHLHCYIQANLSEDKVEKLIVEGQDKSGIVRYRNYSEVIKRAIRHLFLDDYIKYFEAKYEMENLLNIYNSGKSWLFDRCRIVDSSGGIKWITIGVNLIKDEETNDILFYTYMSDTSLKYKWESEAKVIDSINPITGIYDMNVAYNIVRHIINSRGEDMCAIAAIKIHGLDDVFEDNSYTKEDILIALNVFLDTDCVVAKDVEDKLYAFFANPISKERLKKRLEDAFFYIRMSLGNNSKMRFIRFVAAIDYENNMQEISLDKAKETVDKIINLHGGEVEDAVFFEQNDIHNYSDVLLDEKEIDKIYSQALEPVGILSEEDKDVLIECMTIMIKATKIDSSINGVLKCLGQYYQADRVYILMLTENNQIMTSLNEWTKEGRYSIQQSISGKKVSRFPVIARYAKDPKPIFLSKKEAMADGSGVKVSWQYVVLPMEKYRGSEQLLCIENPRIPIVQTALLDKLIPYLSKERIRLLKKKDTTSPLENLYQIPNNQACLNQAYNIDSDVYSSLGVLAIDIPNFNNLKESMGHEYASRFLLRLSEVLRDVFGLASLYHTKESEFVVFVLDVTYDWFINQCARVKNLIGHEYANQYRLGLSWSDKLFNGIDLMNKALSMMNIANARDINSDISLEETKVEDYINSQLYELSEEGAKFSIYLQPKIDIRTNKLVGAEALVRIIDAKGEFLSHEKIIKMMEKNGTIQDLDYYVFDRMLDIYSRWLKEGHESLVMSSNFSRNTLLNPSSLASVLAILSRYPDVSYSDIELEITETAGDFENNTFQEMINRFSEYGIQFSLDDFGSSYSNMAMLADLNFHSVKIDRSMIRSISANQISRTMVKDVIQICKDSGIACIAEGVETKAQADILIESGGEYAQGYLYGRPMAIDEFERKYFK